MNGRLLSVLLYCGLTAAGCGGRQPVEVTPIPTPHRPDPPPSHGALIDKTSLLMEYDLRFADSTGSVDIRIDGEFVAIEEQWKRSEGVPSLRWGTTKARILFDLKNRILLIVNLEDGAFTRITEERIAEENGRFDAPEASDQVQTPILMETPEHPHPAGCTPYARDLPQGLKEETCFKSWERMGLDPPDLESLLSLHQLIRGLRRPPSELAVVIDIAEALGRDAGLLVSRRKFGSSPFEEDQTDELQPWDGILKLRKVSRAALKEEAFELPEDAEERFTLVPWHQPRL